MSDTRRLLRTAPRRVALGGFPALVLVFALMPIVLDADSGPVAAVAESSAPEAAPIAQPAMLAHACAGCHGTNGVLLDSAFMPLAGMPEEVFVRTMIDFREERRPATLMGVVAQGYSDAEIQAMASFFVNQSAEGQAR